MSYNDQLQKEIYAADLVIMVKDGVLTVHKNRKSITRSDLIKIIEELK